MHFTFTPMTEKDARIVQAWEYEEPYATYNIGEGPDALTEMLDRRSPYYAVRDEQNTLVGFYSYGTSAHIDGDMELGLFVGDRMVTIGLGLRPDMMGRGLGVAFVNAGLDFARKEFAPKRFRLYVFAWNERAIRVYEHAGFQRIGTRVVDDRVFTEMQREA
jgi:RimJ/RimL family protein N-acetyltransferase